jgi:hypothetical protein
MSTFSPELSKAPEAEEGKKLEALYKEKLHNLLLG